jgi:4-hydroxy-3-polyprenylbenzoate decarboxylase
MPVAVAIGGDPASCYGASAPLPYGVDEFLLAGFVRKKPVSMVKCKTVDIEVPAEAEIVLEGYVDPTDMRREGPFGDHTGYYSEDGDYPTFHVTAITHRKNPVYLTTIVGIPPQEDFYLGKATERIFLPLMRLHLPELGDINMPAEGVFHNCVIASIDKRYPLQARRLMSAFWGMGQMSFVKTIVVVDADIDVQNVRAVAEILLNRVDMQRDLYFSEGILDVLNHASDHSLHGSKLGIDATAKVAGEPGFGEKSVAARAVPVPRELRENLLKRFQSVADCRVFAPRNGRPVLFAALDKTGPHQSARFIGEFLGDDAFAEIAVLVVLEKHVDVQNLSTVMWKLFANTDPRRDFHFMNGKVGIDATQKYPDEGYNRNWPQEISMSREIQSLVDRKWDRLFQPPPR